MKFLFLIGLFIGCTSDRPANTVTDSPATPVETPPSPTPQASPPSLDAYLKAIKEFGQRPEASREQKVLALYAHYLESQDEEVGEAFVQAFSEWRNSFPERVSSPWLSLFEGDPITCWPSGFTEETHCQIFLSTLTAAKLPALLDQEPAQKLMENYSLWLQLDGAEASSFESFRQQWQEDLKK